MTRGWNADCQEGRGLEGRDRAGCRAGTDKQVRLLVAGRRRRRRWGYVRELLAGCSRAGREGWGRARVSRLCDVQVEFGSLERRRRRVSMLLRRRVRVSISGWLHQSTVVDGDRDGARRWRPTLGGKIGPARVQLRVRVRDEDLRRGRSVERDRPRKVVRSARGRSASFELGSVTHWRSRWP